MASIQTPEKVNPFLKAGLRKSIEGRRKSHQIN